MKTKLLIILLAIFIAFFAHSNAVAGFHYTMLKSTGNACPATLGYLNNFLNGPFSEELGGVTLIRGNNDDGVELELPNGESFSSVEVDFDNDGFLDQVFRYDGGGHYIMGTILYVAYGSEKNDFSDAEKLAISDVKIFPCQFDKGILESSSCPTVSQENDEAGINVSIGKKEVFFRGRYTDIMMVKYKEKTYLILRSFSDDTKMYAAVIEPRGGVKYKSTCIFKKVIGKK